MLFDTPNLIQWTDPNDAAFTVVGVEANTSNTTIGAFGSSIKLLKPLDLSVWLTAQRPALDASGHIIGFASDTGQLELWDGIKWSQVPTLIGGALNGVAIGPTTPSTGAFTSLSSSGPLVVGTSGNILTITPGASSGTAVTLGGSGTGGISVGGVAHVSGKATAPNGVSISGNNFTFSGTVSPILHSGYSLSGTATGNGWLNDVSIATDTVDASGTSNGLITLNLTNNFGGVAKGSRQVIVANATQTSALTNAGSTYVAGSFWTQANFNAGGTNTGIGAAGQFYGINPQAIGGGTATNLYGVFGGEVNFALKGSATARKKVGWQIIQLAVDTNSATDQNIALKIGSQRPSGASNTIPDLGMLIAFGDEDGQWPSGPAGTLLGTLPQTVANLGGAGIKAMEAQYGIDWSSVTFGTAFLKSTGFLVDGSGNTTALTYKVGTNQVVGARVTGWGAASNGAKTAFNGSTATLAQTSAAVAQLIADLTTHGLIGA